MHMNKHAFLSFFIGFIILFVVYHFPEFFQAFWIMAVFKIGFLLIAFGLTFLQGWNGLGAYGLGFKPYWAFNLVKGLCIGLLGFSVSFQLSILLGYDKIILFPSLEVIVKNIPILLLVTSIPSIAEDILTRGYLFGHLGNKMNKVSWILMSAIVFVLNHIWRLNDGAAVLAYLFFLGLLLAYTVWKTKSLWLAFGIHWGSNMAFESINSLFKTKSLVSDKASTWILAAVWGFLFIAFSLFERTKKH